MYFTKVFILLIVFDCIQSEENSTLVLLQIVHRHGDRTPISFYKNDPYGHQDKWVDGLGELTPRGKRRMYEFGQQLRKRYGNYLGDSPKNIYLRSSSSDRCLESAYALASGLYPPKDRWVWGQESAAQLWQPIAVQTVLKSSDGLLVPNSNCPAADADYHQIMRSTEVMQFMDSQKDFIKQIEAKTGENYTTLRQLDYLWDTINAELSFDEPKPVPKWINELGNDTLQKLQQFEWKAFEYDWSSKKVQRLRAGPILKELTDNMENAVKRVNHQKKVYSYSTHDTQIVVILQSLGLYSGIPPSYGSALLFELHRINGKHFLHLFYANVTPTLDYKQLEIKNCRSLNESNNCLLDQFVDNIKEFIPNDWQKECQLLGHQKLYSEDFKQLKLEDKSCSEGKSNVLFVFIGFICGILALFIFKSLQFLFNKFLLPNGNRFFQNSYSLNNLQKNNENIDKTKY